MGGLLNLLWHDTMPGDVCLAVIRPVDVEHTPSVSRS
jgi:hypothetical protein